MTPLKDFLTPSVKEFFNASLEGFRRYLLNNYSRKYADEIYSHACRYGYEVFFKKNMTPLFQINESKRLDVMKSLSLLSKYMGCYDEWIKLKNAYGLKWVVNNNPFPLINSKPFSRLVEEVKELINALSIRFMHEIHFMALSGLRVEESLNAIKIFKTDREAYLNNELKILEHFRYTQTFIRKSKKAFITVLDDGMIKALENSKPITYNMLKSFLFRKNMKISLNLFRKIFATHLREKGIPIEIIDLLQGRIPNNIFVKHYYRPELKTIIEKIRELLPELRSILFS